jgi:Tol biopolymer transport system component
MARVISSYAIRSRNHDEGKRNSAGAQASGASYEPSISADGQFIAFRSHASNLVAGDTNATDDVFLRDTLAGTTEIVSADGSGAEGNGFSGVPAVSTDGTYVAFRSLASSLVAGDTNGAADVFLRHRGRGRSSASA